jgi:hypothetical protein
MMCGMTIVITAVQLNPRRVGASAAEPKQLVFLPRADRIFTGQPEPLSQSLAGWLKEYLP